MVGIQIQKGNSEEGTLTKPEFWVKIATSDKDE